MNETIITGNLAADPEFATTATGKSVANFTVAENVTVNGEQRTTYIRVALWGERSKLANTLHKGDKVLLKGRQTVHVYQGNDGVWRGQMRMSDPHLEYLSPKRAAQAADTAAAAQAAPGEPQAVEEDDCPW